MSHHQAPPGRAVTAGLEVLVALTRRDLALAAQVDAVALELQHDARRGVGHVLAQDRCRCRRGMGCADGPKPARRALELGHVAHRQHMGVGGAHERVHAHAVFAQHEPGLLGQERIGLDTQGGHEQVGLHARAVPQHRRLQQRFAVVMRHGGAGHDLDADALQIALQERPALEVELRVHQPVCALQQGDLQTQVVQCVCRLHAQHATPHHQRPFGLGAADVVADVLRVLGRPQHKGVAVAQEVVVGRCRASTSGQHQPVVRQFLATRKPDAACGSVYAGRHHAAVHADALPFGPVGRHQQQAFERGVVDHQAADAHAVVERKRLVAHDIDLHAGAEPAQGLGHAHARHAVANDHDPLHADQRCLVHGVHARLARHLGRRRRVRVAVNQHRPAHLAHAGQACPALQAQAAQRGQFVLARRREVLGAFAHRDRVSTADAGAATVVDL